MCALADLHGALFLTRTMRNSTLLLCPKAYPQNYVAMNIILAWTQDK